MGRLDDMNGGVCMGHSKLTSNKVANYQSTLLNKLKPSFFLRGQFKLKAALKLKLLLADL